VTCDIIRESLASYAIGTLSSTEAASVEQHLAGCGACRADVEEFAALRPLLARITADDVLGETAPVPDLASRAIAKRRGQRRRRVAMWAVAASIVAGAGTAVAVATTRPPAPTIVAATDATSHVSVNVSFSASAAGTNVSLSLHGVPSGSHCQLIAVGKDGRREATKAWTVDYTGDAKWHGTTTVPAASLAGFEIATTDGKHLVWVDAAKKS